MTATVTSSLLPGLISCLTEDTIENISAIVAILFDQFSNIRLVKYINAVIANDNEN